MKDIGSFLDGLLAGKSLVHYLIIAFLIIVASIIIARILKSTLRKYFEKTKDGEEFDRTNYLFIRNGINFIFFLIATILIFYSIPSLRALGLTLFAGAGIIAAIIGFASQAAFSNIISGLFIVVFKPFRINHVLKVGDNRWGMVEDITLRHTVIRSFQNERYIIPNSIISSETLLNASINEEKTCVFLEMGISYDSDVDLAMKIMQEESTKHPNCRDNRTAEDKLQKNPKVRCRLISFGDSSVNIRAYVWADGPIVGFEMKTDLYKSIKKRFDQEGIEIPFPHRTIVYKNEKKA